MMMMRMRGERRASTKIKILHIILPLSRANLQGYSYSSSTIDPPPAQRNAVTVTMTIENKPLEENSHACLDV